MIFFFNPLDKAFISFDVNLFVNVFIGKNYAGYGEVQNENFLHLLESFANAVEPMNAVLGQLWYDSAEMKLNVCIAEAPAVWKHVQFINITAPLSPAMGEIYWDQTRSMLKVWNGTIWVFITDENPLYVSRYTIPIGTSNATPSNSVMVPIILGTTNNFFAKVTTRDSVTGTDLASWNIIGLVVQNAGTAALIGYPSINVLAMVGAGSNWSVGVDVNLGNLRFNVTGINGTNAIHWLVDIKLSRIS